MADTPLDIAFEASQRGLADQRSRLDNLRTRAATLISAASIVASFLGAEALKDTRALPGGMSEADHSLQVMEIIAIAALVGVGLLCVIILAPKKKGWLFRMSGRSLLQNYAGGDTEAVKRQLIGHIEDAHDANERKLETLVNCFLAAAVLLPVQVVAWLIDLTT